jgi:Tfp pilus assembly protein PilX
MKQRLQQGFAHLGLLLLLIVVVVIALIGYKVWNNHSSTPANTAATTASQTQPIRTTADLDKAEATLNNTNLDNDLNPDSLNQDVSSLL